MPAKTDPRDWERLFNRRQRRGPLSIVLRALVGGLLVLGLIGATPLIMNQIELARVTTTQTQIALQTREARATIRQAATQSAIPLFTPTIAVTPTATPTLTPEPILGRAQVVRGGNIRSAPKVVPATVIGQVCVGDRVELFEERIVDANNRWYRLRVVETVGNCVPERVSAGTEGWVSGQLLGTIER